MKRYIIIASIIVVAVFVILTAVYFIARDSIHLRTPMIVMDEARITFVFGKVRYRAESEDQWEKATVGITLDTGAEIETGEKSKVDIRFNDETAIRLSENTHFILDEQNIRKLVLHLDSGSLYGFFKKLFDKQEFVIRTQTTTAAVRGTELGVETGEREKVVDVPDTDSAKQLKRVADRKEQKKQEEQKEKVSTVYTLSGITEIFNPAFSEERVLLSYQCKTTVWESAPPGNPENMTKEEISRMRRALNSIHTEEVLFISNKILFKTGSAVLLKSSQKELEPVIELLREKDYKVRIVGHTDNVGSAAINQRLSTKRALSVKKYLVKQGIKARRLTVAGFGASKPIEDNSTKDGRALNRRVEFIIID